MTLLAFIPSPDGIQTIKMSVYPNHSIALILALPAPMASALGLGSPGTLLSINVKILISTLKTALITEDSA